LFIDVLTINGSISNDFNLDYINVIAIDFDVDGTVRVIVSVSIIINKKKFKLSKILHKKLRI